MKSTLTLYVWTACFLLFSITSYAQNEGIRKTNSNICHGPESRYYDSVENFKPFSTYEECFEDKGRPPKNADPAVLELYSEFTKNSALGAEIECQRDNTKCEGLGEKIRMAESSAKQAENAKEFAGFRFGIGIALTSLKETQIDDITINQGMVSVNKSGKNRGSLMLETHKFVDTGTWKDDGIPYGHGPFLAISVTDDEGADPFSAYGVGWMIGFKEEASATSWNIGVGVFVNTEATVLRKGITDGQATSITDPKMLTTTQDEIGWMLMFSTNW